MRKVALTLIGELAVLAAFLAIVAIVFQQIATSLTEQGVASGDALFNAALFPKIVVILITFLIAIAAVQLIFSRFFQHRESHDEAIASPSKSNRHLQFIIIGLLIIYLSVVDVIGFHMTTFFIISIMCWVLGARPMIYPIIVSLFFTFGISFLFEGLLKIVLPVGYFKLSPPFHLLGL